jgi:uncharacterized protein YqgC (DUF456 family)
MTSVILSEIFVSSFIMDLLWTVMACCLMIAGLVGSVLPLLPGPPLSYLGMLVLQLREQPAFTTKFLVIWLVVVISIQVLDYVVPIYGTKKFGGTKYGLWGCAIGLVGGFWLGPVGIIAGPFIGAFVGELLANSQSEMALRAAIGSFIGFVFSTLLKLVTSLVMGWYVVKAL